MSGPGRTGAVGACDACLRRGYLIGLLAGPIAGLLDRRGARRPAGLLALEDAELATAVGGKATEEALRFLGRFEPRRARADLRHAGVGAVCRHSDGYPELLGELGDPPAALFCRGRTELLAAVDGQPAATVVGTRDASPYGLEVAHDLGRGLGAAGVTAISGMALGVDGAVHRGALGSRGPTIAVLACGPDVAYPRRHRELHRQICERGLAVSELPPGQRAYRWSFPARNRLMAALGRLTIVVEAGEGSGTLITVGFAQDLGRAVGAVPGRVTARAAAGSNRLLREGAPVIRGAADALDELLGAGVTLDAGGGGRLAVDDPLLDDDRLDALERRLLDAVEAGLDMDAISAFAGIPIAEARAGLARLEALGLVRRDGFSGWERTARR